MGRPGLTRHRKFLRLARVLDEACPQFGTVVALGSLELLWTTCYESGEEYLGDADDVEALAGWKGRRGLLCEALLAAGGEGCAGFIEQTVEGRYRLHDLWDHAPDYVRKRRAREQERRTTGAALQSPTGQGPVTDRTTTGHSPPIGGHRPPNGETRAPTPAPTPAPTEASGERSASPPSPPVTPLGVWLAETYPDVPDPDGFARAQAEANPGVDLLAQAKRARAWEIANPEKRKHRHARFLSNWFARQQDGPPRNGAGPPAKPRVIAGPGDFSDPEKAREGFLR